MSRAALSLACAVFGIASTPVVMLGAAHLAGLLGLLWVLVPVLWLIVCGLGLVRAEEAL